MNAPVSDPPAVPAVSAEAPNSLRKEIITKIVILTALSILLGVLQGWAAKRTYSPDYIAGFNTGLLHGLLMPTALPGLLVGGDPAIYAPNNTGRPYKIGYLFGINACGTLFFGVGFHRSRRPPRKPPQ